MAQVLIRDLDRRVVETLRARARRNHRSLQAELRAILEEAAAARRVNVATAVTRIRAMFADRRFSDSAALIRQDRAR